MNKSRRSLSLLVLLVLLSACYQAPPVPAALGNFRAAQPWERVKIEELLHARQAQISSLRGLARLTVKKGVRQETLNQAIVFQLPDKLRLEFFATNLNRLAAMIISREGILHAVDAGGKKVYVGAASAATLGRLIGIPFVPADLMLWLCGRPPAGLQEQRFAVDARQRRVMMDARDGAGTDIAAVFTVPLDGKSMQLVLLQAKKQGETVFSSAFEYADGSSSIPRRILFDLTRESLHGVLDYEERVETNPELSPELQQKIFQARIPAGARVIDLESAKPEELESLF